MKFFRILVSFLFLVNVSCPAYPSTGYIDSSSTDQQTTTSDDNSGVSTGYIAAPSADRSTATQEDSSSSSSADDTGVPTTIQGQIIMAHADDFVGKKDYEFYFLKDKSNTFHRVKFKNHCGRHFAEGQNVKLHGSQNDQVIQVQDDTTDSIEDLDHGPKQRLGACKPGLSDVVESDDDSDGAPKSPANTPSSLQQDSGTGSSGVSASSSNLPLSSVPMLHSNPNAPIHVYLNFVGAPAINWLSYAVPATPAFGDATTFTPAVIAEIQEIWGMVAELYSSFNVDITTDPGPYLTGPTTYQYSLIIGGSSSWLGASAGGVSYIGSFDNRSYLPPWSYVFPDELSWNSSSGPKYVAEAIAHELGHGFGLYHQATWNQSTLTADYYTGNGTIGPVMGDPYYDTRLALWWHGINDISPTTVQDDMAVISSSISTYFSMNSLNHPAYAPSPSGITLSTVTPMTISGNSLSSTLNIPVNSMNNYGIIQQNTGPTADDVFSFTSSASGNIVLNATPSSTIGGYAVGCTLQLYDSSNNLLATSVNLPTSNLSSANQILTVPVSSGSGYYVSVSNYDINGDTGTCNISGTMPSTTTYTLTTSTATLLASNGGTIQYALGQLTPTTVAYSTPLTLPSGTEVGLIAVPNPGFGFVSWSGNASGTTSMTPLMMNGNETVTATFTLLPPAAPYPSAAYNSNGQIVLSWGAVLMAATYTVLRSTTTSGFTALSAGTKITGTTFTDTTAVNGTPYYYEVEATNAAGTTASSYVTPPPTAITGLTATAGNNQVSLSWNASLGASTYTVLRSTTNQAYSYSNIYLNGNISGYAITGTSFTDTSAVNGTTYYYEVYASGAGGISAYSSDVSAKAGSAAPSSPTGLSATPGNNQVSLSWTASSGATSYTVERSTSSSGTYSALSAGTAITTTSFTDSTAANGTTYYYEVEAINGSGSSPLSSSANATPEPPAPSAPTNLTATPGTDEVTLNWTASPGATSYIVKWSSSSTGTYTALTSGLGITATSYLDSSLTGGTTYYYEVIAVNGGGQSAPAYISATPTSALTVNAGNAQTLDTASLPVTTSLNGSVTDNASGTLTTTWTYTGPTGTIATFSPSANAVNPTVTLSQAGAYTFTLTAQVSSGSTILQSASANLPITVNVAPVVNAGSAQTITLPATATLSGTATDVTAGTLTTTWSYTGPTGATATFSPSASSLTPTVTFSQAGSYAFTLTAENTSTSQTGINTVTVTVNPANVAPVVNAGNAQTITLPATASLSGTATDVTAGTLTSTWAMVSGPGTVTFTPSATSLTPTATFSQSGSYVLSLTTKNTATSQSTSANVTITVNPANVAPVVNAGNAQTITLPATASLSGTATDVTAGTLTTTWSYTGPTGGTATFSPSANVLNPTVTFSQSGSYILTLTAKNTVTSQSTSANVTLTVNPAVTTYTLTVSTVNGTVSAVGSDKSNIPNITTASYVAGTKVTLTPSPAVGYVFSSWSGDVKSKTNPLVITMNSNMNLTATFNVNQAPIIIPGTYDPISPTTLPATLALSAIVNDDGLPNPGTVTTSWSKVSGPGTIAFTPATQILTTTPGTPMAVNATASFSQAGSYVLALSASDGQLTSIKDVTVTVNPPPMYALNITAVGGSVTKSPNASSYTAGTTVTLTAVNNAAYQFSSWSGDQGVINPANPMQMTFVINPNSNNVTANFTQINQPPIVSAGSNQSLTMVLPGSIVLSGSVKDDGLPLPGNLTTTWSVISYTGPGSGNVTFSTPTQMLSTKANTAMTVVTSASFSDPGTYVLALSASDGQLASNTSTVTINITSGYSLSVTSANGTITKSPNQALYAAGSQVTLTAAPSNASLYQFSSWGGDTGTINPNNPAQMVMTVSRNMSVTASFTAINQAPYVVVGANQVINLPSTGNPPMVSTTLSGAVKDDGLPVPGNLTATWSLVSYSGSGTGNVILGTPTQTLITKPNTAMSANSTAKFSDPGNYVLAFTVSDGALSSTATMTVVVNPAAMYSLGVNINNASYGSVTINPLQQLYAPGTQVTLTANPNPGYGFSWGSGIGTIDPNNPLQVTLTINGNKTIAANFTSINTAPVASAGSNQEIPLPVTTLNGQVEDDGFPVNPGAVTTTWSKVSGPGSVTFTPATQTLTTIANTQMPVNAAVSFSQVGTYVLQLVAKDGQLTSAASKVTVTVDSLPNYVLTINAPNGSVALSPAQPSAGYPVGTTVTMTAQPSAGFLFASWGGDASGTANPLKFVINANSNNVTANFAVNTPPIVLTGVYDNAVPLSSILTLNGKITDDGLPNPGTVTTSWTKVSGPGSVSFTNANPTISTQAKTPVGVSATAKFSQAGVYVLRLTANDGQLSTSKDVLITVASGT